MRPAVELTGVSASRGGRPVLHEVSLAIAQGETMALVGRSGSGKTTVLRLLNGLLDRDGGVVAVDGRDTHDWNLIALRRRTGYVIQETGLFPHFTVAGNVGTVPRLLEWPEDRVQARVAELLALVGLDPDEFAARWPDELSGGQRQRVGLARALAADPPVLLMDEPFGALDPITRSELHAEFLHVQASLHRTVVLVTHDMHEARVLADRIAILHEGRIIACDTAEALDGLDDERVQGLISDKTQTRRRENVDETQTNSARTYGRRTSVGRS